MAFAECCEFVGRGYEGSSTDAVKKWYGEAKSYFEKAQRTNPDDLSITVGSHSFLSIPSRSTRPSHTLEAILNRGSATRPPLRCAWARRGALASTLVAKGDPEQARKALALFEATEQTGDEKPSTWEEDQRVLAKVLNAQKTPEHRKRAIEIVTSLVGENPDNLEDRLLLAQLDELAGDWPKAREQYDELITRTENKDDPDILGRRVVYLELFIRDLIRHSQANENQELAKAQELLGKLKALQPGGLNTLVLEVALNQAQGQLEKQAALKHKQAGKNAEEEAALEREKNHRAKRRPWFKPLRTAPT